MNKPYFKINYIEFNYDGDRIRRKIEEYSEIPENFSGLVDYYMIMEFYKDGLLHREDGPAVIYDNNLVHYFFKRKKIII